MVAKLICQAKVEGVHCGAKAFKAELAIGFQARKMELCKKASKQNSPSNIHFLGPEKKGKAMRIDLFLFYDFTC